MNSNFMSFTMHLLGTRVVGVFVGHKESGFDITTVGIFTFAVEDFFIQIDVVVINGIIKSNCNHLRNVFSW